MLHPGKKIDLTETSPQKVAVNQPASPALIRLGRYVPVVLLVATIATVYALGWHRTFSLETLVGNRAAIDEFIHRHGAGAVLAYVGLYAMVTTGALPAGGVLAVVGGFLFGTAIGGLGAMIGSTLGASALYSLARSAFGARLVRSAGPRFSAFAAGFRDDAFCYILFLRFVPSPSWLTSVASGALGVRSATFVTATALGRLPGSFVFALFGSGFGGVIAAHETAYTACRAAGAEDCRVSFSPADVLTPAVVTGFIVLALLALGPVVARRFLRRRASATGQ